MGRRAEQRYLLHVVPGLEAVAAEELGRTVSGARIERTLTRFDERTSLLLIALAGSPASLLECKTVEDVFALVGEHAAVPSGQGGLAVVRGAVATDAAFDTAVTAAFALRPARRGRVTFRVIARKSGRHTFRRVDVQHAVELGVSDRFRSWRLVEDDARFELWTHLVDRTLLVGLRLSDNTMRGRTYRQVSLPAALKPTIAHAMVLLTDPRPDDVFLDPMCGSGTLVIERALVGRYRQLLAGDINPDAVAATLANVGTRYKPIRIERWDARRLQIEDASVSAIACNLPFGKQIGTVEENRLLYPELLHEMARILQPAGRMVLLSSDEATLRRSLAQRPELLLEQRIEVLVRGLPAAIHVIRRDS